MQFSSLAGRLLGSIAGRRHWASLVVMACLAVWAASALGQEPAPDDAAGRTLNAAAETVENPGVSWENMAKFATVIALIIVPIVIGNMLAKRLRMPDYGWRFALAIGSIAAAVVIILQGEIKLGPDLRGGITLIYELQDQGDFDAEGPAQSEGESDETADEQAANDKAYAASNRDEKLAKIISTLTKRIDPSGTKEISVKKFGDGQLEIIIPEASDQDLEYIERKIYTAGILEFRITASRNFSKHENAIRRAEALKPNEDIVKAGDREIARWVPFDTKEFGDVEQARDRGLVTRMSGEVPQALVLTDDGLNVTGEYLRSAISGIDDTGRPQVEFLFNSSGAGRFKLLTGSNLPNPSGERYSLGILLDGQLLSAPTIESRISDRGTISGGTMNQAEVDLLVGILNAGSLPAAINKTPISKAKVSATLGEETVTKAQRALLISLAVVAIFMSFYYRFSGWVAVAGLACNMLLIVAVMVLIKAAFTLPGLAGLVLTVGMSVDANVLIYERIREELARGAALRMGIRNGFARATQTIIDSNVTNLITGIVIYKIAPDNVKGFGVTLVLGIIVSIYSAVFLTRIVFDVAERMHWIKRLPMRQMIGATNIDFLKWGRYAIAASLIIIAVGMLAVYQRWGDLFDIDFTGGSSVTIVLDDDKEMTFAEVMDVLQETKLAAANLSLVRVGETNTRYTITTVNDNVDEVESILTDAFKDRLKTYRADVKAVTPTEASQTSLRAPANQVWQRGLVGLPTPLSYLMLLQQETSDGQPAEDAAPAETEAPAGEDASETDATATTDESASASAASDSAEPAATTAETTATDVPGGTEGPTTTAEDTPPAQPAAAEPGAASTEAAEDIDNGTTAKVEFGGGGIESLGGINHDALSMMVKDALAKTGREGVAYRLTNPQYDRGSIRAFKDWDIQLALPEAEAQQVFNSLKAEVDRQPVFPLSNKIGGRVAGRMATDAIAAIVLCLIGIIAYVWFRFHGAIYGIAAVAALIHDVLVTLGFVAFSSYMVGGSEAVSSLFMVEKFQINLTLVAAFLTIIGYSLNDTIVIFDRIREIKGKSPRLTREMINLAVNQTLARTILTSFTTLTSVTILYIFGGDGIHAFAYALFIGLIAGCYSTIFIANPVLLWLSNRSEATATRVSVRAALV